MFNLALVIRVTQTFWWFGKNNRFQPFLRFHVRRTLKTDIHPYDEKIILTNAWPISCACSNQMAVGKRYLMLTHSRVSRQTLKISTETVFLERAKRYTKRLLVSQSLFSICVYNWTIICGIDSIYNANSCLLSSLAAIGNSFLSIVASLKMSLTFSRPTHDSRT